MLGSSLALPRVELAMRSFVAKVYGWMAFAMVVTALAAMVTVNVPELNRLVFANRGVFLVLILAELGLVVALSAAINRMSAATATVMFVVYSALNGLTMSFIFLVYTEASIASAFLVTAATFGAMSVYGYTTNRDLTSIGNLCFMALIGIIIASLVNLFLGSATIYWATTYIGVLVFVGLTAYDTQKIKVMGASASMTGEQERKGAILGALALYLDFINLFLLLLRIFGRRR
ncbi:MAG: Bax inhibitor-1/YccA family protein [Planctomycetes bacterium]|nr:Bax inhibitor-1/YccA family protein [Planctomycetota bacterium]